MLTADNELFVKVFESLHGKKGRNHMVLEETRIQTVKILMALQGKTINDLNFALIAAQVFDPVSENEAGQAKAKLKRQQRHVNLMNRGARVTSWVAENLEVGQMVKMSGTRDGQGYRKVMEIKTNRDGSVTVVGQQFTSRRHWSIDEDSGERSVKFSWTEEPYITDHMAKKVIDVEINGKWHNLNDLTKVDENDD